MGSHMHTGMGPPTGGSQRLPQDIGVNRTEARGGGEAKPPILEELQGVVEELLTSESKGLSSIGGELLAIADREDAPPDLKESAQKLRDSFVTHESKVENIENAGGWIQLVDNSKLAQRELSHLANDKDAVPSKELRDLIESFELKGEGSNLSDKLAALEHGRNRKEAIQDLIDSIDQEIGKYQNDFRLAIIDQSNDLAVRICAHVFVPDSDGDLTKLLELLEESPRELNKTDGTPGAGSDNDNQFLPARFGLTLSEAVQTMVTKTFDTTFVNQTKDTADHIIDTTKYLEHMRDTLNIDEKLITEAGKLANDDLEKELQLTQGFDAFRSHGDVGVYDEKGWQQELDRQFENIESPDLKKHFREIAANVEAAEKKIDEEIMKQFFVELGEPHPTYSSFEELVSIYQAKKKELGPKESGRLLRCAKMSYSNRVSIKCAKKMDQLKRNPNKTDKEWLTLKRLGGMRLRQTLETYYGDDTFSDVVGQRSGQRMKGEKSAFAARLNEEEARYESDLALLEKLEKEENQAAIAKFTQSTAAPKPNTARRPSMDEQIAEARAAANWQHATRTAKSSFHPNSKTVSQETSSKQKLNAALENIAMSKRHKKGGKDGFIDGTKYHQRYLSEMEASVQERELDKKAIQQLEAAGVDVSEELKLGLVGKDTDSKELFILAEGTLMTFLSDDTKAEIATINNKIKALEEEGIGRLSKDLKAEHAQLSQELAALPAQIKETKSELTKLEQEIATINKNIAVNREQTRENINQLEAELRTARGSNRRELEKIKEKLQKQGDKIEEHLTQQLEEKKPLFLDKRFDFAIKSELKSHHKSRLRTIELAGQQTLNNEPDGAEHNKLQELRELKEEKKELLFLEDLDEQQNGKMAEEELSKLKENYQQAVDAYSAVECFANDHEQYYDRLQIVSDGELAKRRKRLASACAEKAITKLFETMLPEMSDRKRQALTIAAAHLTRPHNPGGDLYEFGGLGELSDRDQLDLLIRNVIITPGLFTDKDANLLLSDEPLEKGSALAKIKEGLTTIAKARCGQDGPGVSALVRDQGPQVLALYGLDQESDHARDAFIEANEALVYRAAYSTIQTTVEGTNRSRVEAVRDFAPTPAIEILNSL